MNKKLASNASFEEIAAMAYPILERHGVVRAGLFGSFARGEAGAKSDVDIVADFGENRPTGAWLRYDVEIELEKKLHRKVDFGQYNDFKDTIWQNISRDEILIMAKQTDFRPRIQDILDCIELLEKYTGGVTQAQFDLDFEKQDAVVRRIEIIGDAIKYIPYDVRFNHPDIPWKSMAGLRDIAIHQYKNLKNDLVWQAATIEIPKLKEPLVELLKNLV
jgi:uncharacterized protein with HEPN domain/predicted nucleotidyltransferase